MDIVSGKLTVFFEDPFWVGMFERVSDGRLSVCKVMFGAEPKDYEVYDFVLKNYYRLRFSPAVATNVKEFLVLVNEVLVHLKSYYPDPVYYLYGKDN